MGSLPSKIACTTILFWKQHLILVVKKKKKKPGCFTVRTHNLPPSLDFSQLIGLTPYHLGGEVQSLWGMTLWRSCKCASLLNRTRVHSPNTQQSQSTDTRMWWKKYSIYCRAPSKEEGQLMLRWFPTPGWLSGKGFLKTEWERGLKSMYSACVQFWLVGREVTMWGYRGQHY